MKPARPEPIAIVGMGCVFPGAADLGAFWNNLSQGVDAISEVPAGRWDPVFYDPDHSAIDRVYCRRGGFVDDVAGFDPLAFGVMPRAAEGAEPDQLLTLQVASAALRDAGLDQNADGEWRLHTGVVLGRGGYLTPGLVRLEQRVRTAQQLIEVLRSSAPQLSEESLRSIKAAFQEQLGPYGPDTAIGLVPNLAASRVANRLDLHGPAYTIDAACASSLVAVDQACRELWSGRCEVMLAGGVHLCQDVTFWSVFTQLGALSRNGQIRPFDRRADGLLIGEGAGVVVLKRLVDAERDGDRIYARILGVGVSSDGRGTSLLSPRVEGQLLALRRGWEQAGVEPESVGMIEAHGTATVQGDEIELQTLTQFFGNPESEGEDARIALGSVKSMIGHAMPAAGAAGLIKTALSLHHGIVPPSLHCEEPHPLLLPTRFRVPPRAEPWPEPKTGPRRAGVNAFGFGGINSHAVLEADSNSRAHKRSRPAQGASDRFVAERWLALSASTPGALVDALSRNESIDDGGPCRLVLFDPSPERRSMAQKVVRRERVWHGHDDLWFTPRGLLPDGGKIAFVFPGLEPRFEPRVDDVADFFGWNAPKLSGSGRIEEDGLAVVEVSRLLFRALKRLGLEPEALAGHSVGEWSAMIVSQMIPPDQAQAFVDRVVPGALEVPDVLFAAAGCSVEKAREAIGGLESIGISHDNCPHQVILCGAAGPMETALSRLRDRSVLAQKLPFRSGFHSELFAPFLEPHKKHLASFSLQSPTVPLWSATTCERYPSEAMAIRSLAIEHLIRPVRFRELTLRLYQEGFRVFVQVGSGTSLTGFIDDTLKDKPHLAISANVKQRSGLAQLRRLMAAIYCEGGRLSLEALQTRKTPELKPLRLDVPLVRLPAQPHPPSTLDGIAAATGRSASASASASASPASSPVIARFSESLRQLARSQEEVMEAFARAASAPRSNPNPNPNPSEQHRHLSIESHPYLIDHCFYRQPANWPEIQDRYPVVPMTLMLDWLRDLAGEPGRVSVLEDVRALRWLAVAPPTDVTLRAHPIDASKKAVSIEGFSQAVAMIDRPPDAWSMAPPLSEPLVAPPIGVDAIYRDRWMFHGPGYQGIRALHAWSRDGVDGELQTPSAPGGLLDNAGQLLGLWVMMHTDVDRMAFPVRLERVEFFSDPPREGERVRCAVRIRELTERAVRADLWLSFSDGRPYCRITGWEDRRFDSDARLWEVLLWPERNLLAVPRSRGYLLVTDAWRNLPSRDLLARRYLNRREREQFESLVPRRQGPWLNGRIAVKDAVRNLLWQRGHGALFPAEIEVHNDSAGRPWVRGPFGDSISVSLAHTAGGAVARVAEGRSLGIDLERIEPRPEGFINLVLSNLERSLLPEGDAWLARVWTAKEAVAKLRGTGLGGDPKKLPLQAVEGERVLIDGIWVETTYDAPFIIAWSEQP